MSTIYLATAGSYSDYRVIGAYSTEAQAEAVALAYCDSGVESFELDVVHDYPPGCKFYRCHMSMDGDSYCTQSDPTPRATTPPVEGYLCTGHRYKENPPARCFAVWATDRDEAVKIVNERRITMLAAGTWDK